MNVPDITLIIQIIHFLIAYTFLRKFVFSPALRILNKQEVDYDVLYESVKQTEKKKQKALNTLQDRWLDMKQALYGLIPSLVIKHFTVKHDVEAEQKMRQLDQDLSATQRSNLKNVIIKTVSEVKI